MYLLYFRFKGPDIVCKTVKFGQVFPLYLSSFLLTLMAVDRVGVTKRAHAQPSQKTLRPLIQFAWVLAFVFSVPNFALFSVMKVPKTDEMDCWVDFEPDYLEVVRLIREEKDSFKRRL